MRTALFYTILHEFYTDHHSFSKDIPDLNEQEASANAIQLLRLLETRSSPCPVSKSIIQVGERNTIEALRELSSAVLRLTPPEKDPERLVGFLLSLCTEIEEQIPTQRTFESGIASK